MGSQSAKSSQSNAQSFVPQCLEVLANGESPLRDRRVAFERLRGELAPSIAGTPAFAAELRRVFAVRYEPWCQEGEHYIPTGGTTLSKERLADRIRGLIFGAALGDAIGLATEFMSKDQVAQHYPESHVFRPSADVFPDTHRISFPKADWTDDTDQLLLVLQTILEHGGHYHSSFASKLLFWKEHGFAELGDQGGAGLGQSTKNVLQQSDFLTDPISAARRVWIKRGCHLAPNGAIMRTAVAGVPTFWDEGAVRANTVAFCQATHADPRCAASCIAVTTCVRMLLRGEHGWEEDNSYRRISDLVENATASADAYLETYLQTMCSTDEDSSEKTHVSEEVIQQWRTELRQYATATALDDLKLDDARSIGYTFKCMGCALWALRSSESELRPFENIIQQITRAAGDADTNATVAGALVGTLIGFSRLPQEWLAELAYGGWLEAWVQKILFMLQLPIAAPRP